MLKDSIFILKSFRALIGPGIFGLILLLIYTTIGLNLFDGELKCGNNSNSSSGEYLNNEDGNCPDYGINNYDSYPSALLSTFRIFSNDYVEDVYEKLSDSVGCLTGIYIVSAFLCATATACFTYGAVVGVVEDEEEEKPRNEIQNENEEHLGNNCKLARFTSSFGFELFITFVILLNVYCVVYELSAGHSLDYLEMAIYFIYVVECCLKLVAERSNYFKNGWNIFDLVVALVLIFDTLTGILGYEIFLPILPLTTLKLIRRWSALNTIFAVTISTLINHSGILLFTVIIWVLLAAMGQAAYGKFYYDFQEMPNWNFTTFVHSLWQVARSWAKETCEIMWDCVHVAGKSCSIYFTLVHLFGVFLTTLGSVRIVFVTLRELKAKREGTFGKVLAGIKKLEQSEDVKQEKSRIFSIVLILVASVLMAMEPQLPKLLTIFSEAIFILYFTFTCVVNLKRNGTGCLKSPAWIFDLMIILEAGSALILTLIQISTPTYLLFIHALRPLMIISRIERLRSIAAGIGKELELLSGFLLASAFIWLHFGIQFQNLFSGKFWECYDEGGHQRPMPKFECQASNLTWTNSRLNFDWGLSQIYYSLSFIGARNGWIAVIVDGFNSRADNEPFEPEGRIIPSTIAFLTFLFFGVYFLSNLLFGVVLSVIRDNEGFIISSPSPPEISESPKIPKQNWRQKLATFISSEAFGGFIMIVILLDFINLSADLDNTALPLLQTFVHSTITLIYTLEMLLKIMAFDINYFKSYWNLLDLLIVVTSIAGDFYSSKFWLLPRPFRLLRIFKCPFFIKIFPSISRFNKSLSKSLPIVLNIFFLQILAIFSYSIFGMRIFGAGDLNGKHLFQNFQSSLNTLYLLPTFNGAEVILFNLVDGCATKSCKDAAGPFVFSYLFVTFLLVVNCTLVVILGFVGIDRIRQKNPRDEDEMEANLNLEKKKGLYDGLQLEFIDA